MAKSSSDKKITQGTYDYGVMLRTSYVNVNNLPKFFKKGIERNKSKDKTVIEKTDRSMIVEKYQQMMLEVQKAKSPPVVKNPITRKTSRF